MPDVFSKSKRSKIMASIGSKDTVPERYVRSIVHRLGYRFKLHVRDLPGTPDIVLPRHQKIIFMHSCFFHRHKGCSRATMPETRQEFWKQKIEGNVQRDYVNCRKLKQLGWDCLIVWQCEIRKGTEDRLRTKIRSFMES